uniref:Uncharacterized protein n=1 Tax=Arundo donax TaxID=35708 RepID=A0A0A9F971_ARUDO
MLCTYKKSVVLNLMYLNGTSPLPNRKSY